MPKKQITQPAPDKISDQDLYSLVKGAKVIFTVEEKIHFLTDE